jgi:hypothetical protein
MTGMLTPQGKQSYNDNAGNPLAGGKVWTYAAGTNTPKTTWSDAGETAPNTNPVILDARGEAVIFWDGAYKVVLQDSLGNTIWTVDNVQSADAGGAASAVLTKLADNTTAGNGADAVGVKLTGAGMVSSNVAAMLNLATLGLKKHFGCALDGATDDQAKIANAFATVGKIIEHEGGTALVNSNLPAPACAAIVGQGDNSSIFKFGAAVTQGLGLDGTSGNYPRELRGFQLAGDLTNNAVGLFIGNTGSVAVSAKRVQTKNFKGASAIGLKVDRALKSYFESLTQYGNQTGMSINGSGGGFPTTLVFENCVTTNSVGVGVMVVSAQGQIRFIGGNVDSSGLEGVKVIPGAGGTVLGFIVDGYWLEANYSVGNYMMTIDGSAAGCTAGVVIRDTFFNTVGGGAFALHVTGSGSRVVVANPMFNSALAGNILVDAGAVVRFDQWNPSYSMPTVVTDNSGYALGTDGKMQAWAPVYTPSGGGTFSAVSTNLARFRRVGANQLKLDFNFAGTVAGVVNSIAMSIANAPTTISPNWGAVVRIQNGGAMELGIVSVDGASNLVFTRLSGAAFSAGTAGATGSILIETTN